MRKYKILLYDDAVTDYKNALKYYEGVGNSVAKKFKTAVNNTFKDLKNNPFYQIRYDDFRLKVITKFPYIIHFKVDELNETVLVYGIRCSYQNPETSYIITPEK